MRVHKPQYDVVLILHSGVHVFSQPDWTVTRISPFVDAMFTGERVHSFVQVSSQGCENTVIDTSPT